MFKKFLPVIAAASMALSALHAQPADSPMHGQIHQKKMHGKKKARGMRSVFLIQRGLPHYSMILMKMWDDPKLALTEDQKKKLETIRNETMQRIMQIAPQVKSLRKKIVKAAKQGAKPETLYADVDRLAALKAKATKVQLECMDKTRELLSPEQLTYIDRSMKHKRKKRHQK